jgi:hypothetical protein
MKVDGPVPKIMFLTLFKKAPLIIPISETKLREISGGKRGNPLKGRGKK